jgi:Neocarzinostatin family
MAFDRSVTRRLALLTALCASAVVVAGSAPAIAAGRPTPQITVIPNTGLVDGQIVSVSGSGFQEQAIAIIECGGGDPSQHPPVGPVCSDYAVVVSSDTDGNFAPVDFSVAAIVVGTRYVHGNHLETATYDCLAANDCYLRAYALTRAFRSAAQGVTFGA